MGTPELRNTIIQRVSQIDDKAFLKAINTILTNKVEEKVYTLNTRQRKEIEEARKEIQKGNFFSNETLTQDFAEWLSKK